MEWKPSRSIADVAQIDPRVNQEELARAEKRYEDLLAERAEGKVQVGNAGGNEKVGESNERSGEGSVALQKDIVNSFIYDAADRINKSGKDALNAFADGDELRIMHIGLKRFTKVQPYNSKAAKRRIADKMIEDKQYAF